MDSVRLAQLEALEAKGFVVLLKWDGERTSLKRTIVIHSPNLGEVFRKDGERMEGLIDEALAWVETGIIGMGQSDAGEELLRASESTGFSCWTDLLLEPQKLRGLYAEPPELTRFTLEALHLEDGNVHISGCLGMMPKPLPPRWAKEGYTHARARFGLLDSRSCEIDGTPLSKFDELNCLEGCCVDLEIRDYGQEWTDPNGILRPLIEVTGHSSFVRFRIVCEWMSVGVQGFTPSPY